MGAGICTKHKLLNLFEHGHGEFSTKIIFVRFSQDHQMSPINHTARSLPLSETNFARCARCCGHPQHWQKLVGQTFDVSRQSYPIHDCLKLCSACQSITPRQLCKQTNVSSAVAKQVQHSIEGRGAQNKLGFRQCRPAWQRMAANASLGA